MALYVNDLFLVWVDERSLLGVKGSHYHDAILVVVDRLTKMALFIPTTKSMAAPEVASLFLQYVV